MVAATVFYRIKIASMENKIADMSVATKEVEKKIADIEKEPGYNKLWLVRKLLAEGNYMPWSRHIPILIDMLLDLQKVDSNSRDKIELYDFRISLEEIELKGMVSRLLLLYYTSPERWFKGLIDRFRELDFVRNIRIQTYVKDEDQGLYDFALFANVVVDGQTGSKQ